MPQHITWMPVLFFVSDRGEVFFVDQRKQRLRDYAAPDPVSIEETLAWMYRRFDKYRIDGDACAAQ